VTRLGTTHKAMEGWCVSIVDGLSVNRNRRDMHVNSFVDNDTCEVRSNMCDVKARVANKRENGFPDRFPYFGFNRGNTIAWRFPSDARSPQSNPIHPNLPCTALQYPSRRCSSTRSSALPRARCLRPGPLPQGFARAESLNPSQPFSARRIGA
jgi:hypothetical protein